MSEHPARTLPRPFTLHWGRGHIVEEVACSGLYHEPAIQLLQFEDGRLQIRFCYYDHEGRFQRSPLIVGEEELAGLRAALAKAPRLRSLLRRQVE
jgi:hypothetical protein